MKGCTLLAIKNRDKRILLGYHVGVNIVDQFPESKPFVLRGSGEAVLMFHGFTSAPHVFRPLAEYISKVFGYEIYVPLLPGHGLTPDKLRTTKANHWIHYAENELVKIAAMYKKIHVMGISMGGTLAAHLAVKYPDVVESLTLFSPAMFIKNFWSRVALECFVRFLPESYLEKKIRHKKQDAWTDKASYQSYTYADVVEFDKVCRFVRNEFHADAPMRVFMPVKDEVIDPQSSVWFYNHGTHNNRELIQLTRSPHLLFTGDENELILKKIDEFFQSVV